MKSILVIARLTMKSAFRYRVVVVLAFFLLGVIAALPWLVWHDGTARMLAQLLLTYGLSLATIVLCLSALWLSCGTLAREVSESQLQVVLVKPVARWQLMLGKWLGVVALNAILLGIAGAGVYGMLKWQASRLPAEERDILNREVLVSRGVAREKPTDLESDAEAIFREMKKRDTAGQADETALRQKARDEARFRGELLPPNHLRRWEIDLGWRKEHLAGTPLQIRAKFFAANMDEGAVLRADWAVGPGKGGKVWRQTLSQGADAYQDFTIPAGLINDQGRLVIEFSNRNETTLLFPTAEGLEVLYPDGSFEMNYLRALFVTLCWTALVAALGLSAASFMTFPVASLAVLSLFVVWMSGNLITEIATQGLNGAGDGEGEVRPVTALDRAVVPVFSAVAGVMGAFEGLNAIEAVSTGRGISWEKAGAAFLLLTLLPLGSIGLVAVLIFNRRELATAGGNA